MPTASKQTCTDLCSHWPMLGGTSASANSQIERTGVAITLSPTQTSKAPASLTHRPSCRPVREHPLRELDVDNGGLAGIGPDASKSRQPAVGTLHHRVRTAEVDLHRLTTGPRAGVGQLHPGQHAVAGGQHLQCVEPPGRVTQAGTERQRRFGGRP